MSANAARRLVAATVAGVLLSGTAAAGEVQERADAQAVKPGVEAALTATSVFAPAVPQALFGVESQPARRIVNPLAAKRGLAAPALRRGLIVSFGALQVLDAHSTLRALDGGAREANPAMAGLAKNRTALFAVKAGTAAATAYFVERMAKRHPRRALIVVAVLNTAYAAVVAHNYRVARNQ